MTHRDGVFHAGSIPRLTAGQYDTLALHASDRFAHLMGTIRGAQWEKPTDCVGWTVRDIALHQVAVAESWSSLPELMRQYLLGLPATIRRKGQLVDGANAVGIRDRSRLSVEDLLERSERSRHRLLEVRRRSGRLVRGIPLPTGPLGWITVGDLFDIILTRDTWMHRVDICRATGRRLDLDAELDRLLIADMVRDWAGRHRRAFQLNLLGPAGGRYGVGGGGESIEIDAVEFARTLSGRRRGEGLLATQILF